MIKLPNVFNKHKRQIKIDEVSKFGIPKEEADTLFGGFREYVPPIYDHKDISPIQRTNVSDLLSGIHLFNQPNDL
jgi:hypothetical protein